jgi:hypothetical protein
MREYESEFADTTKRDKGTAFHAHMDRHYKLIGFIPSVWKDVDKWALDAVAWSDVHLRPRCESIASEMYVAFNFTTGEVHVDPSVRDRKYPSKPGFLPGTVDLVCVLNDGTLLVADWKTGHATGAAEQLMSLAIGLREVFRTPSGALRRVALCVLRVGDDGVWPDEWQVTDETLAAHRTAMQFQLMDVGKRTEPAPGIHCTQLYCNHLAYCPGITATVETAAESPQGLLPKESLVRRYDISAAPKNSSHAGAIMERVTAAKRQLDFYQERIRAWCDSGNRCISGDYEYSKQKDGFRWRTKKA